MLKFEQKWRFHPPQDGKFINKTIPNEAVEEFFGWINRIIQSLQYNRRKWVLEHFKKVFSVAIGKPNYPSSSADWAESDLLSVMRDVSQDNAPIFIEAFWDGCQSLKNRLYHSDLENLLLPDQDIINSLLQKHKIGYRIQSNELKLLEETGVLIEVEDPPISIEEKNIEIIRKSLNQTEELLAQGKGKEAVQETLWLLESITTAFRGIETENHTVEGKYFNKIVKDLRKAYQGNTIDRVLEWISSLHGYLSSPTGGGIRHGLDLKEGIQISLNEARLYCNLIRSYISYLLAEHERLTRDHG